MSQQQPAMEFAIDITQEELLGAMGSTDVNDQAMLTVLCAVIRAWRAGDAMRYLPAARAIANGRMFSESMLAASDN